MTERPLRGALIGAGSIAPYHLTAWLRVPYVEIVAVYNRTRENAAQLATRFGVGHDHVYDDLSRLFATEPRLDFVDIVTAPDLHRAHVEQAAGNVDHLLCQKPFALSLEDANVMIACAELAGSTLTINENWRWRSWYRTLKQLIEDGVAGNIQYVRISAHHNVTLGSEGNVPALLVRQSYTAQMPRLIVFEWGIHLIDTLRMLFGEPHWVHANMNRLSPHVMGEDRALMTFGFDQLVATVDISWSTYESERPPTLLEEVVIEGDRGTIALVPNRGDGDLIRVVESLPSGRLPLDRERPWSPLAVSSRPAHDGNIPAAYQASFDVAHAHYAGCWRANTTPETGARDNLRTLQATFAAYRSAALNEVVKIDREGRAV
jgi:predicted dehydrogenase